MRLTCLALVASIFLAGCASETPSGPEPTTAPEEAAVDDLPLKATDTTGVIRGVVVDEAVVPIAGATVTVVSTALAASTTSQGAFGFDGVEPGTYFVTAEKLGFLPVQQSVQVEAGLDKPPVVKFQLARDANFSAYFTPYHWKGYLECTTNFLQVCGAPNTVIQTFCQQGVNEFCGLPQEVTSDDFQELFEMDRKPTWVQAEIAWESTQVLGDRLGLIMEAYKLAGLAFEGLGSAEGTSPVVVAAGPERINGTGLGEPGGAVDGLTPLQLRVFAGASDTADNQVGAVVEQEFEVFIHVFYNMQPPQGWRFSADGAPPPA